MATPTIQDFEDGKRDLDDLEKIVNLPNTVPTRIGGNKLSVDQALSQIIVGEVAVYSAAATYTGIEDWVEYNGVVYRPLPSALPIGSEVFDGNKWAVVQGYVSGGIPFLETTNTLILSSDFGASPEGTIIETLGFTTKGDGGAAQWRKTGVTGLTASQTPAQLADAKLTDANGHEWELAPKFSVDIRQVGAMGDGVSDDTLAVQAALNLGGPIHVAKLSTNYRLSNELVVSVDETTINGKGQFQAIGAGYSDRQGVFHVQANNCAISDIEIDAAGISTGRCIKVSNSTKTCIDGVTGRGAPQAFVWIGDNAVDTYVHNSKCVRGYGVLVDDPVGSSGLFTCNNFFDGNNLNGDGIEVNAPTNGFDRFSSVNDFIKNYTGVAINQGLGIGLAKCTNWRVTNPHIQNIESDGLHFEDGSDFGVCVGGLVLDCNTNGAVGSAGVLVTDCDDVTINGVNVKNAQQQHGISIALTNSDKCRRVKIVNNTINGAGKSGMRVTGTSDCMVANNIVRDANQLNGGSYGIQITGTGTGSNDTLTVNENKIIDGSNAVAKSIRIEANTWFGGSCIGNETGRCLNNNIQDNGGNTFSNGMNTRSTTDRLSGRFTPTAATTSTVVTNGNSNTREEDIALCALNSSAASLMNSGNVYITFSGTSSFTVAHPSASGSEIFGYQINT